MDHVKSRGRIKFFTCFSPVFADDETGRYSDSSVTRKKRARRGFAAAMKAVFFKASSAKKSRSKTSKQDPFRSDSGYSSSSAINAKSVNSTNKNSDELLLLRANSNASSVFSPCVTDSSRSSSRSSSISSNSRSGSERLIKRSASSLDFKQTLNPQAVKRDGEKCGCTVGMCIFFLCLVALVFLGKVSAILTCTSACLFFAPACQPESAASSVDLSPNDDVDSEEDKKRVIMEGLLERNRPRVLQP